VHIFRLLDREYIIVKAVDDGGRQKVELLAYRKDICWDTQASLPSHGFSPDCHK
jgi:hypothetical protein